MKRLVVAVVLSLFFGPAAKAAALIVDSIKLPATFSGTFGTDTIVLDAIVVRPNDAERHPLAVINHGTPRIPSDRKETSPRNFLAQAREFARRGWVAVTFTRRGYGKSEGSYAEGNGNCGSAIYEPAGRASADDVREVIRLMSEKPYVDSAKIISVGRSAGGFATVALTADPPPGLVAAISFAGGRGSAAPDAPVCNEDNLDKAFAAFGKTSRIPMLWVYAENDHYFGPAAARRFYDAFTGTGGKAKFIAASAFGDDGHGLFSRAGIPIWSEYVDAFLEEQNLKLRDQPLPIDDTNVAVPKGLTERGKVMFLDFLDAAEHKAFVMSDNGHLGWRAGRDSDEDAVEEATELCMRKSDRPCHPVMINDKVVPEP
jgi:dienelactone hydrolase